jgi:FdhD protein
LKIAKKIKIKKIKSSSDTEILQDTIPSELFLTIILNNNDIATISCSPSKLTELTAGYLINNGYIRKYSEITDINIINFSKDSLDKENRLSLFNIVANVSISPKKNALNYLDSKKFTSFKFESLNEFIVKQKLNHIKSSIKVSKNAILKLNSITLEQQEFKKKFGGLHSAALFDKDGNILILIEDIGRHNCIDKIEGYILINNIDPSDKIIFTTGRLSFSVIYKICRMSVPVIVTNSSITYSAVRLAKKLGLTAVGYARDGRFNIYSGANRILTN